MPDPGEFGAVLTRLSSTIAARRGADPKASYTASLIAKGAPYCAMKLLEEAQELAIAATSEPDERVASEAGDVLYHLLVLLAARGVDVSAVAAALIAREGRSGHEEKASRKAE